VAASAARKPPNGEQPAGDARASRLKGYRAKRKLGLTPEPAGGGAARAGTRRFVVQEHHARSLHWDLRLEREGVLVSWAVPKGLPDTPNRNHFAASTEDHPLEYLEFEGAIPKGHYGAGTMTIWDHGTYECLKWEPRKVEVALHGERLNARYALFAISEDEPPKDWMIHRMDPPADPDREPMPARIAPMLARAAALPRDDGRWAHEIKWDGVRAIAYSQPGALTLQSRNLNDVTGQYPELGRLNRALGSHSAVLDGEIVGFDEEGRPSFAALQHRTQVASAARARRLAARAPVTYMIFDVLWLDGHSLMGMPYTERRELLAGLRLEGERWQTPGYLVGNGPEVLQASAAQGLEGIVAKRLDSTYEPGRRTKSWVKVKNVARQAFVVAGWMPGKGKREENIGALLVGVNDEHRLLRYAGRVGSGFSDQELARLKRLLAPLARARSPFAPGPIEPPRGAVFCEPRLVAEIEFTEWTKQGSLRHPVYKGLREEETADLLVREDALAARAEADEDAPLVRVHERTPSAADAHVEGRDLKLSNLGKVLYPRTGFTKRDLIDYYVAVAPVLLGHLAGRPLTVTRWPDGVDGKSFFQKQAPAHRPEWVRTVSLPAGSKRIDYILADDEPTLVWLANLAALELHTPLARAEAIERPTALVFDLDPGEPATVIECCRVGLALNGMFEHLGLQSFAKTSGSKGLQVYLPLNRKDAAFDQTKTFAKTVAELLERSEPELVVSRMTKARRSGKVFIDWSQNDQHKTTVCAYSLRSGGRPTASTPVDWDEVAAAIQSEDPDDLVFESQQVLERVTERGDPFAPVLSLMQRLPSS
jgi:bifunctional non-homologous end joining protein LigD